MIRIIVIITSRIAVDLDSQSSLWILIEKSSFDFQNKQKLKANSLQELWLKCKHTNEWFLPNSFRKTRGFFGIMNILTDMFTFATDGNVTDLNEHGCISGCSYCLGLLLRFYYLNLNNIFASSYQQQLFFHCIYIMTPTGLTTKTLHTHCTSLPWMHYKKCKEYMLLAEGYLFGVV